MKMFLTCCLLLLASCAASQGPGDIKAAEPPPKMAVEQNNSSARPGEVNVACKTDGDCKIKDVGSCCGYRPACVNQDSPTFADEVKAQCGKSGMAGICGFPSISGCTCVNNKCEGVAGAGGEEKIR